MVFFVRERSVVVALLIGQGSQHESIRKRGAAGECDGFEER